MEKILKVLVLVPFVAIGLFNVIYSRRLASALVKSSNSLRETFNMKGTPLGRGVEIFAQVFLIIFGAIFIFVGIRLIAEVFKS